MFYDQDGIVIYHGNCLEIMPTLATESVSAVITDVPFGVSYVGRYDDQRTPIVGDSELSWIRPAFAEIYRVLEPDSFAVTTYGWPHAEVFLGAWREVGFRLVSHLVLIKDRIGLGRMTRGQHEVAYLLAKGKPPRPKHSISDVIEWTREADLFHPNQKPVHVIRPLVTSYAREGGVILDPFMGSGTTLVAAMELGNPAIGIEIEERYCRFAASRLSQKLLFTVPRD
jgi:site-specific DNA-methyltransferase (adenine-specific)